RLARPDTDRFVPWGRQKARPLARFLAKQRLARPVMERLPVLAAGDDVLWAVGIRRSAHAPIGPATRRIVRAIGEKPQGAG
ncbi:MAG TPA: tRNA lysidine(34) synthetase TilS C-terminal domain-containing protein, partial [Pantanalinema sp.]